MIASVHSERTTALGILDMYLSAVKSVACALVAADCYPALSVRRVDGRGGTLVVGAAYHRDEGQWWFVTREGGRTVWIAPTREPQTAANLTVAEMSKRVRA
ncbi:hypothetical protein [Actinomadura roseirufa]|uniref:hypothetical protein n=1 Tax=Actinomadura roseirufa TaxID=2094049 RepID=UPI001041A30F|nr:hypothetical protein [Actinomadura roseirufa]